MVLEDVMDKEEMKKCVEILGKCDEYIGIKYSRELETAYISNPLKEAIKTARDYIIKTMDM